MAPSNLRILRKLLLEEKRRVGLGGDDLYYIGMANTAGWWWCARKSVLSNRNTELSHFAAHLDDRVKYSKILGYINDLTYRRFLSRRRDEVISALPELTKADIEKVMKTIPRSVPATELIPEEVARDIADTMGVSDVADLYAVKNEKAVVVGAIDGSGPAREGIRLELTRAERYPMVRWAFRWRDFMVTGVPDGITDEFVYEFKTVGNKFLLYFVRPVAFIQADLYGYFFGRPKKRVQIFIRNTGEVKTWIEPVDAARAEETLQSLWNAVRRGSPTPMPREWKCRKCEYKEECSSKGQPG